MMARWFGRALQRSARKGLGWCVKRARSFGEETSPFESRGPGSGRAGRWGCTFPLPVLGRF